MNTTVDAAGTKDFLIWIAFWIAALVMLLPALSGS